MYRLYNQSFGYHNHKYGYVDAKIGIETNGACHGKSAEGRARSGGGQPEGGSGYCWVNVNTIRNMEARGAKPITSSAVTVRNVQLALEALGIEFLNHARPGVRLSVPSERSTEMAGKSKAAVKAGRRKTAKAVKKKNR